MQPLSQAGQLAFGDIAPKLAQISDQLLFDDIWQRPQLTPCERSLITVAALVALNRSEQLPFHLQLAQRHGVRQEQLAELITHLAFYAGWPVAASAVTRLRELGE
ncbi:4-carboxymuconolactone decarboxylase [Serratia fonticola]|jgi:4-carboxymuconolactone decarboxylase|uniref:4-carboxymuconolactone decarboxylase n=1 Tax=Serratia fonticola TaxID=47917 RepID=A0A542D5B9_SERFO|nr:carboxymuconolactone decarboxylase family protein [Serratia fonticola]TQI79687.1 4-carboxymuconolactone decarboxylase [Serratia fonticola]TQI98287.1 4-carboxymuconolactone decarboxylase [Serratia fonticola]TVZ67815.1 4-carboxymuconolactone decarboxylase [Serratia fonticola]